VTLPLSDISVTTVVAFEVPNAVAEVIRLLYGEADVKDDESKTLVKLSEAIF